LSYKQNEDGTVDVGTFTESEDDRVWVEVVKRGWNPPRPWAPVVHPESHGEITYYLYSLDKGVTPPSPSLD
jgi:hypothetical protein